MIRTPQKTQPEGLLAPRYQCQRAILPRKQRKLLPRQRRNITEGETSYAAPVEAASLAGEPSSPSTSSCKCGCDPDASSVQIPSSGHRNLQEKKDRVACPINCPRASLPAEASTILLVSNRATIPIFIPRGICNLYY